MKRNIEKTFRQKEIEKRRENAELTKTKPRTPKFEVPSQVESRPRQFCLDALDRWTRSHVGHFPIAAIQEKEKGQRNRKKRSWKHLSCSRRHGYIWFDNKLKKNKLHKRWLTLCLLHNVWLVNQLRLGEYQCSPQRYQCSTQRSNWCRRNDLCHPWMTSSKW